MRGHCGAAEVCAFPAQLHLHTKKSRFSSYPFFSMCVFGHTHLQVVGLDTNQRPDSRGDPAGEGKGRQSGNPKGPEIRPGSPEDLGRKLSGKYGEAVVVCETCLEQSV